MIDIIVGVLKGLFWLLVVAVLVVLIFAVLGLVMSTNGSNWWYTLPAAIFVGWLAWNVLLFLISGGEDLPGVHPDDFSQGPGMQDG